MVAVVPAGDELADLGIEVFHAGEVAAADGLAVDDPEPNLDEVQPGPNDQGDVHVEAGCLSSDALTPAVL